MNKTCTQCGGINKAQLHRCCFCDSPLHEAILSKDSRVPTPASAERVLGRSIHSEDWKRELEHRLEVYRSRRKRLHPNANQGAFPFEASGARERATAQAHSPVRRRSTLSNAAGSAWPAIDEAPAGNDPAEAVEEFAFAIGIGPPPHSNRDCYDRGSYRVEIDLTEPPLACFETPADVPRQNSEREERPQTSRTHRFGSPYSPLATLEARAVAGCIDAVLLLFSYGGFLTLFGSLGGHFSFSKFSAVVYTATLLLFYVLYFSLFTIFGGVTPGMMLRRLELVNFDGEAPTPRQLLQRSFGYIVSGGTFLLGFVWALWDENQLTWQDRMSSTYLTKAAELVSVDSLSGPRTAQAANK